MHVAPRPDEQARSTTGQSRIKPIKLCCCIIFICVFVFMVVFVIGAMCIGLFLRFIPFKNQFTVLAKPGDTVLVQIPYLMWIESIDTHLLSSHCSGSILTVNCDQIEKDYKSTKGLNAVDGIYLIQSSAIAFNVSRVAHADKGFHVWLFPTLEAANTAVLNSFHFLACSNPPENTYCEKADAIKQRPSFTISLSSYYYLRCDGAFDINCAVRITIVDNYLMMYNFTQTKQHAINQDILNVRPHVERRL